MGSNNSKSSEIPPGHVIGICLDRIRKNVTEEYLTTFFSEYGRVRRAAIRNSNAYVTFNDKEVVNQILAYKYFWIRGYRYKVRSCLIRVTGHRSSSENFGTSNVASSSNQSVTSNSSPANSEPGNKNKPSTISPRPSLLRASTRSANFKVSTTSPSENLQWTKILDQINRMSTENKKVVKENKALKNENENLIEQVQSVTAENGLLMDKVTHLENQNKSYEMLVKETEERNTNSSKISGEECIFCFSNRPDHAFIRCGHVCLCNGCVNTFQKKEKKCPICRKDFDFIQKIFF